MSDDLNEKDLSTANLAVNASRIERQFDGWRSMGEGSFTDETSHDQTTHILESASTALTIRNPDSPLEEMRASLVRHAELAEALINGKSEEQRIELGRKFHVEFLRHAEWALCKAAYLGVTLRSLFRGKSDKDKERVCKEVTGYSLSEGRRYVKFVDHLPFITDEAARRRLVMEEIGLTGCLSLVPKQQGRGGRPPKNKGQNDAPAEQTQPDASTPVEVPPMPNALVLTNLAADEITDGGTSSVEEEKATEPQEDVEHTAELTVTIRSNFRSKVPLREIQAKLTDKQATLRLVLSVQAVVADEILGEGEADEILEYQWSEAASEGQDARVPAVESETARNGETPLPKVAVVDDNDGYFS